MKSSGESGGGRISRRGGRTAGGALCRLLMAKSHPLHPHPPPQLPPSVSECKSMNHSDVTQVHNRITSTRTDRPFAYFRRSRLIRCTGRKLRRITRSASSTHSFIFKAKVSNETFPTARDRRDRPLQSACDTLLCLH